MDISARLRLFYFGIAALPYSHATSNVVQSCQPSGTPMPYLSRLTSALGFYGGKNSGIQTFRLKISAMEPLQLLDCP
jgi:hypothetical protein